MARALEMEAANFLRRLVTKKAIRDEVAALAIAIAGYLESTSPRDTSAFTDKWLVTNKPGGFSASETSWYRHFKKLKKAVEANSAPFRLDRKGHRSAEQPQLRIVAVGLDGARAEARTVDVMRNGSATSRAESPTEDSDAIYLRDVKGNRTMRKLAPLTDFECPAGIEHFIPAIPALDLQTVTSDDAARLEHARHALAWAHHDRRAAQAGKRKRSDSSSWVLTALELTHGETPSRFSGLSNIERAQRRVEILTAEEDVASIVESDLELALLLACVVEVGLARRYASRFDLEPTLLWRARAWASRLAACREVWARWVRARWVEVLIAAHAYALSIDTLTQQLDVEKELSELASGLELLDPPAQSALRAKQARAMFLAARDNRGDSAEATKLLRFVYDEAAGKDQRINANVRLAMLAKTRSEQKRILGRFPTAVLDPHFSQLAEVMRGQERLGWRAIVGAAEQRARQRDKC